MSANTITQFGRRPKKGGKSNNYWQLHTHTHRDN